MGTAAAGTRSRAKAAAGSEGGSTPRILQDLRWKIHADDDGDGDAGEEPVAALTLPAATGPVASVGWGGRDGEAQPGGARVAAAGRAPGLENAQSKPLTNQGMKPGGEGAEERFGLRSPPPNIPGPITQGRGRVWRIPGENAATATRHRPGSLPPDLEDSLPPISEDFGFSQARSPSPGRAAGPSLRSTQPGGTAPGVSLPTPPVRRRRPRQPAASRAGAGCCRARRARCTSCITERAASEAPVPGSSSPR